MPFTVRAAITALFIVALTHNPVHAQLSDNSSAVEGGEVSLADDEIGGGPGGRTRPHIANHLLPRLLVRHAGDILEALEGVNRHPVTPPTPIVSEPTDYDLESGDGVREAVAVALSFTPVSIDEVARQTDLPVSVVQLALTELELAGRASRLSGGMASLKA